MNSRVGEARLHEIVSTLRAAGCVFAEDEADLLVAEAPTDEQLERMVHQRVCGLPLEQVLGWAEFCGSRVFVEPGVFVPRRRTELLAEVAMAQARAGDIVVELCCGSGAVAMVLGARVPGVQLHAADIDAAAVRCARRNVQPVGGSVHHGDLYAALPHALRGHVQLVLANAPYVPSDEIAFMPPEAREHEPTIALDGGPDGVAIHRLLACGAADWLATGGQLIVETSAEQADLTAAALRRNGLVTSVLHDPDRDATVVAGSATL